jgi:hypothetical protein
MLGWLRYHATACEQTPSIQLAWHMHSRPVLSNSTMRLRFGISDSSVSTHSNLRQAGSASIHRPALLQVCAPREMATCPT